MNIDLSAASGAIFSDCRKYRYLLWRRWDNLISHEERWFLFVGMNPSKADAIRSDPTVSQMRGRAQRMGCTGLLVVNCSAFVSTDPKGLIGLVDAVGPLNEEYIRYAADVAGTICCAWGNTDGERAAAMEKALLSSGKPLYCLDKTSSGNPRHPRGVSLETEIKEWKPAHEISGHDRGQEAPG